ncbi:MAG: GNAT family N-acetyltransferase [Candidatus Korobacteraceae bacterium]|jgi:GNAT superfamily N-acetyltransferase
MSESRDVLSQQLPDFVDLEFARRLEMAETAAPDWVEAQRRHSPLRPPAAETIAGGVAFFGGPTYPANQSVGMGLYGEVHADDVDRVETFYRSRGVPSTVVVSPLADPALLLLLGQRGYRIAEFNSVLIRRIGADEPFTPPVDVVIERVSEETAAPWSRAIAQGFSDAVPVSDGFLGGFAALPGALNFLARIDGTVVGGCCGRVIPEARIAALSGTATLPEFRRRGVQTALIAMRLHEAGLAGCEYAVVSTQPGSGSQRNMERRGFRVAYTKVVMVREWPELATSAPGGANGH